MAARSEWTKQANPPRIDRVAIEAAQREAEAFSVEAEAGAGDSQEVLVETEAMGVAADLNQEAGDTVDLGTTMAAAEVKAVTATDLLAGPIETVTTVTLHTTSKKPTWLKIVLPMAVFIKIFGASLKLFLCSHLLCTLTFVVKSKF